MARYPNLAYSMDRLARYPNLAYHRARGLEKRMAPCLERLRD
jgi:hypothetical protein